MIYELAKQLKEAGFPQRVSGDGWFQMPDGSSQYPMNATKKFPQTAYVPTLSELIEASLSNVGGFGGLVWRENHIDGAAPKLTWIAFEAFARECEHEGSTPEEAVAKLWLALHPKT
jgi:hypothetical protein